MGRLIRLDWAIKKILRDKANFEVLEGFLSELLRFDVTIVEILESESNKASADDKFNRVDLLVKDENDNLLIIEVQNQTQADYLQRLVYGTSKAIVEHLTVGRAYAGLKKVYSVSIVYFDLGVGEDYLYHGTTSFKGLRRRDSLSLTRKQQDLFRVKAPEDLFPEYYLIKVPKFDDQIRDSLDEWIYFLKHEDIKDEFKAKGLLAARDKLDVLKMDNAERIDYEAYLEKLRFEASMVLSHYGSGHFQARVETAKRMLARGMDPVTVVEMTDLSSEYVAELQRES